MSDTMSDEQSNEIGLLLDKADEEAEIEREAYERRIEGMRTKPVIPRLNFEIPAEVLRGVKVAAALQDSTIKLTVISILDEWLRNHPELSSYEYGGPGE